MNEQKCNEICADPELIMCVGNFNSPDYEGTEDARRKQMKFIVECPLRNRYKCKFENDIKKWIQ